MSPTLRSLVGLVACLAAACSQALGGESGQVETARIRRADVRVATPVPTVEHPLTGVLYEAGQPWQRRPALSVKIENSKPARPQAGLEAADLVYEELAEGGITRFIAVFQSTDAPKLGPVRSARRTDADVLAPLGGLFAFAGAVPPVVAAVRSVGTLQDVSVNHLPGAYYRVPDRPSPHNLYTSTAALWRGRSGSPPPAQFAFLPPQAPGAGGVAGGTVRQGGFGAGGEVAAGAGGQGSVGQGGQAGAPEGGEPATSISFSFASEPVRYDYDPASGSYRRFQDGRPHLTESGAQVAPVNVIIQVVTVTMGGVVDVNGQPSPDSRVVGEGEVILLRGGRAFRGRWIRPSVDAPTRFVDAAGNPLRLARGRTWIELLPEGRPLAIR